MLDSLEQGLVQDRRLFSWQDLAFVFDLANEEAVPEEVGEGPSSERDAAAGLARAEGSRLGADVLCPEVPTSSLMPVSAIGPQDDRYNDSIYGRCQ